MRRKFYMHKRGGVFYVCMGVYGRRKPDSGGALAIVKALKERGLIAAEGHT
jgi:hypothetical protein